MTNRDRKKLLLSDTAVPDLFISDYMSSLSLNAIKLYLYLLLAENHGRRLNEKQLESRFAISSDDVRLAVTELCLAGLTYRTDKGMLKSVDIKSVEVDAYIQTTIHEQKGIARQISPENDAREKLTQSIAATFFHGSMSFQWYQTVDILLDEYRFEHDVVYRLFKMFKDKGWKLVTKGILNYATHWHDLGIHTMENLSEYEARQGEVEKILAHLGERLRIRYDGFDQDIVRVWVEKLKYSFEIVAYALEITRKNSNRTNVIKKVDARLLAWFAAGVQSLQEAVAFEQEKEKTEQKERMNVQAKKNIRSSRKKQNFEEISYSPEEISRFESDPDEFVAKYIDGINDEKTTRGAV